MYELSIDIQGKRLVNNTVISQETEEKVDWTIYSVEDFISNLEDWICDAKRANRTSDLEMMRDDMKLLISQENKDTYMLSSLSTNAYLFPSENTEEYQEVCKRLIEEEKQLFQRKDTV